jgi:cytochrome c peroxidase
VGRPPTAVDPVKVAAIVAFERSITTAQSFDDGAGALDVDGARGGPAALATIPFQLGENAPFEPGFDREVFDLYAPWFAPPGTSGDPQAVRRAAIARGEQIFNNRPIEITGVAGLNDVIGRPTIIGTCSTCHNSSGAGSHSRPLLVDLGLSSRRAPDQPLYTFVRTSDGATLQTTDPGLALTTGRWADLNKFKVPVLRGLAMRAPYFHNGAARDLPAVVGFYDVRFRLNLSPGERADLVAFLQAL